MHLIYTLFPAGELAKFRLVPFGTVFSALKALLDDFAGHNVEAAAELLDTAGRFLYRLPETHSRMANMAEVNTCPTHELNGRPTRTHEPSSFYYHFGPKFGNDPFFPVSSSSKVQSPSICGPLPAFPHPLPFIDTE